MKTIFDESTAKELINRIDALKPENHPVWGKMTPFQMVRHCIMSEEIFQGKRSFARLFIGRLFGSLALSGILKNDAPMKKNQPTHPELKITGNGDLESEKRGWKELIELYSSGPAQDVIHPFFGKMTHDEIGRYVYKHADHHLRQFSV